MTSDEIVNMQAYKYDWPHSHIRSLTCHIRTQRKLPPMKKGHDLDYRNGKNAITFLESLLIWRKTFSNFILWLQFFLLQITILIFLSCFLQVTFVCSKMSQKVLKIFLSELLMHKGIFAQLFQKHLLIIYLQSIYLLFMFSFMWTSFLVIV